MQDVRVIGVESGALVLATDGGSEYRLPVTGALPGQVRQANPDGTPKQRLSPKDVQARIRAGATAEQVAESLGVEVESVRRFEGPVLAERAFVLDAARRVSVTPSEQDAPDAFGDAITDRLESGDASDVDWSAFKDAERGWRIRVRYTATDVEHDAQWDFDPKTATLTPDTGDAHRLSHTDDEDGLTPRLRAVEFDQAVGDTDSTRFDSGAFRVNEQGRVSEQGRAHEQGRDDEHGRDRTDTTAADPATTDQRAPLRAPLPRIGAAPVEERAPGNETADLLEALRRRRGERESAAFGASDDGQYRTGQVSVVDIPLEGFSDTNDTAPQQSGEQSAPAAPEAEGRSERKKRTRRSMPSWDEIVFGTRPDDDIV